MLRIAVVFLVAAALGHPPLTGPAQSQTADVTGAWDVTITMQGQSVTGLAIFSQDGSTVTGMIGPAITDMMPAEGTIEGDHFTFSTRPRRGRTAAFAKCEATVTGDRMTGTIDTDKGAIELVRRKREAAQDVDARPSAERRSFTARTLMSP